jgi:SAM-dependent methyltransferase
MGKVAQQLRGLVDSTTHFGGALTILRRLTRGSRVGERAVGRLEHWMGLYTDYRTRAFDRRYGTDTYERAHLSNLEIEGGLDPRFGTWMYGPINPDFFREMMRGLPIEPRELGFYDVGAGKGLALMLASEYPFRELVGIEFSPPLVDAGRKNVAIYERATGRSLGVEWVCADFMQHPLPDRPSLFFMNAPFPWEIAEQALAHIEASIVSHPRKVVVLYRKPHGKTVEYMDASRHLRPLKTSPYWRAWSSR